MSDSDWHDDWPDVDDDRLLCVEDLLGLLLLALTLPEEPSGVADYHRRLEKESL